MIFAMSLNNLHPRLRSFVQEKWKGLTEIQQEAFEPIYTGQSCTIEAPTSGGKTEAVLFPLLSRIKPDKNSGFKVLYIAPLKALLNDLELRIVPYAKMSYLEAFKWHGDVSQGDKIQQMIFPSDILLTTPESIEAILLRKANWAQVFENLETVVIDEAHYFALTERGSHLVSLLERLDAGIGKLPQRIAVTATIGNPNELLNWMSGTRTEGKSIRTISKKEKEKDFCIHYFDNDGKGLEEALYRLLAKKKSIVFERSRSKTEETAARINEFNIQTTSPKPIKVRTHHSSVSKQWREKAEKSIKLGTESSLDAIISTSTLELGIDIGDLDQVIQVGGLNSPGSFLQRVGRTGRREGRPQFFRGLCADEEELTLLTGCVSLGLKHISESILFPKKAFHILAHQIICMCLQKLGATEEEIWKILSRASCFSGISYLEFKTLINFMLKTEYLRSVGQGVLVAGNKSEEQFLRANWKRLFAIFDTGPMYNVVDGKKMIGTLDSAFAQTLKLPFVFVLGGQEWNAVSIDHEMQQVKVKKNTTGQAPKWKAIANYDIPFELAQEVGRILMSEKRINFLDPKAQMVIKMQRNLSGELKWTDMQWLLESTEDNVQFFLWTFAGDKVNRALSILFEEQFLQHLEYDYKRIIFTAKKDNKLSRNDLINWLCGLKKKSLPDLEKIAVNQIAVKWFSKFSECLPEELAKKAIQEKATDFRELLKQINRVKIDCLQL